MISTQNLSDIPFSELKDPYYTETTYSGEYLIKLEIWVDSTKDVKLFTKDLTYDGDGNLIQLVLTNEQNSAVLTKIITYNPDDSLDIIDNS